GILIRARWSSQKVLLANVSTALTATAGVVVTLALADLIPAILPGLVAFATGQLIYVALADLLPEIHHRTSLRTYILEISAFILAVGIMWVLTLVE
ncbi:ZIP family metal transporter, partial [Candidatus Dojkabacteria bacterium]|nr:ZIP family metal transporter [Candidatus Dojkabacteria bacterium]